MNAFAIAFAKSNNANIKLALDCQKAQAKLEKPKSPKYPNTTLSDKPEYCDYTYGEYVDTQIDGWEWVCTEKGSKLFDDRLKAWEVAFTAWEAYRKDMKAWRKKFPLEAL